MGPQPTITQMPTTTNRSIQENHARNPDKQKMCMMIETSSILQTEFQRIQVATNQRTETEFKNAVVEFASIYIYAPAPGV